MMQQALGKRLTVVGYTDPLVVSPGQVISFQVSCEAGAYTAGIVRLLHGDTNPKGPGVKFEPVTSDVEGRRNGRRQELRPGSHIVVPDDDGHLAPESFTLQTWVMPTAMAGGRQTIAARSDREGNGWTISVTPSAVMLDVRRGWSVRSSVRFEISLVDFEWFHLSLSYNAVTSVVEMDFFGPGYALGHRSSHQSASLENAIHFVSLEGVFYLAAEPMHSLLGHAQSHFNGRLDNPVLFDRPLPELKGERLRGHALAPGDTAGLIAAWDFGRDFHSRDVVDRGPHGLVGRTVNMPTRAVPSHMWDGTSCRFLDKPSHYAAIHFHDDDLDDAGWTTDFSWNVPREIASGIYAAQLKTANSEQDFVPFVVSARSNATADIAVLIPTFSYLAYANEHMADNPEVADRLSALGIVADDLAPEDAYIATNRLHSTYDRHSDGTGVCHSSWLRPVLNLRPTYRARGVGEGGAPHQLAADLYLVDWLDEMDWRVDFITDEDVHHAGVDLLRRYRVVLSGTHPEYASSRLINALRGYLEDGGRFMYLGGNGYYWGANLDEAEGHTIEVRRWGQATRTWDAGSGEWFVSGTGELGGLWRHRGIPAQRWLGIGTSAAGTGPGRPYRRTERSYMTDVSWVFRGIQADYVGQDVDSLTFGGAVAGFETDRFDRKLGSPISTIVLASATGFGSAYHKLVDDVQSLSESIVADPTSSFVRADMVLLPYPGGGCVFSVGAITWCAGLSSNEYGNSVSAVTNNVLERFISEDPPLRN